MHFWWHVICNVFTSLNTSTTLLFGINFSYSLFLRPHGVQHACYSIYIYTNRTVFMLLNVDQPTLTLPLTLMALTWNKHPFFSCYGRRCKTAPPPLVELVAHCKCTICVRLWGYRQGAPGHPWAWCCTGKGCQRPWTHTCQVATGLVSGHMLVSHSYFVPSCRYSWPPAINEGLGTSADGHISLQGCITLQPKAMLACGRCTCSREAGDCMAGACIEL